jgi:hypothetical protein
MVNMILNIQIRNYSFDEIVMECNVEWKPLYHIFYNRRLPEINRYIIQLLLISKYRDVSKYKYISKILDY